MKKKIYALSCIMLFLLTAIPTCTAQETVHDTALDTMLFAHVVIKGTSTPLFIGYHFILGFGRCYGMIANLDTDGYVEINKLFDNSNTIVVEGSRTVILIGFVGYLNMEDNNLNLNGAAVFAAW